MRYERILSASRWNSSVIPSRFLPESVVSADAVFRFVTERAGLYHVCAADHALTGLARAKASREDILDFTRRVSTDYE